MSASAVIAATREPRFVAEFAQMLEDIGPTAFKHHYKRAVLVGYGIVGEIGDRPVAWRRRTLPTDTAENATVAAVQSIVDRVWPIRKDPGAPRGARIILGASADCDIVVPDYSVSTQHCSFAFEPGRIIIGDLDSLNGTRISGKVVAGGEKVPLVDRSPVWIGRIKVQYLTRDSFFDLVTLHATGKR